jgi:alpha-methylacyl-CoA racemase
LRALCFALERSKLAAMGGPLSSLRVVEIAGLGPAPMACMLLADLGAEVVRIERLEPDSFFREPRFDLLARGRRSIAVNLKQAAGVDAVLRLVERADVFVEGFRPGVTERLGIGPEICHARNPRLVYGRMTGWGQTGPLAQAAGHDINYLALTGALHAIGRAGQAPVPPMNLLADFGGGAMYLVVGILAALLQRGVSGRGQVVDAAMVDGAAHLTTFIRGMFAAGLWVDRRGENLLDTGAPFYDVYETSDGKYVSVGALETRFWNVLADKLGLSEEERRAHAHRRDWPVLRERLTQIFRSRTRDAWCELLEGTDACFAPVLSFAEAPKHAHNAARAGFATVDGIEQPAAAPRFDRTPADAPRSVPLPGADTGAVLRDWGFSADEIDALERAGCIPAPAAT